MVKSVNCQELTSKHILSFVLNLWKMLLAEKLQQSKSDCEISRIISRQKYNLVIYGSIAHENKSRGNLPIHIHMKQLEAGGSYNHIIKKPCLVN